MSKKILISFIISVVASGFIYVVTKDENPKQNNVNGNNIYIQGDQIITQTKEADPKKP